MKGLGEGVAQGDHAAVAPRAASLHHHPGHLDQRDGALTSRQGLAEVQDLRGGGWGGRVKGRRREGNNQNRGVRHEE